MLDFLPTTRAEALARLEAFLPQVTEYAATRNQVLPGHGNVSRLSPTTRTRVILEREIFEAIRALHSPEITQKFEQEVWWRLYWKGWLEQRPEVWSGYREAVERLEWSERAAEVAAGRSGIAIIDHFTRELIETGYLHNHARLWWASWWIHGEGLPWQIGADFFLRHLRDGDAASNTLSWRWVAGLHTRGKAYLVRRSNLEQCIDPDLLAENAAGLERLEAVELRDLPWEEAPAPRKIESTILQTSSRPGIWIHDEDLCVESSPLSNVEPVALIATASTDLWERERYSPDKRTFLESAIADGAARASSHFGLPVPLQDAADLVDWAVEHRLDSVLTLRPFTGPLADELPAIESALGAKGIRLQLLRRPEDVEVMNLATAGFFGFWEKVRKISSLPVPPR